MARLIDKQESLAIFELEQPLLPLNIDDRFKLENFYWQPSNQELQQHADSVVAGLYAGVLYFYGVTGEGRSHLLQGICEGANKAKLSSYYLPLAALSTFNPKDLLQGLDHADIICLDDLNSVIGNRNWEESLFHLFNAMVDRNKVLVVCAQTIPNNLPFALADLRSRMASGMICHLHSLEYRYQKAMIFQRCQQRGYYLNDSHWSYIVRHGARNTGFLLRLIDALDRLSLDKKRVISIALIKELTGW